MAEHKIDVVRLSGGILGALGGRPHVRLGKHVQVASQEGWHVVQVIPEGGSNVLQLLISLVVLLCTLLLWCPMPGYMVVMKRG